MKTILTVVFIASIFTFFVGSATPMPPNAIACHKILVCLALIKQRLSLI